MNLNIDSDICVKKEINRFIEKSKKFCDLNKLKYSEIQSLYFYMKDLESCMQKNHLKASINVQHITDDTVDSFYEQVKNNAIRAQEELKINISPEILYKMQKDRKYAADMIAVIAECAHPKNFSEFQLLLYDYNIFVKSDGTIEVVSYGTVDYEQMRRNKDKLKSQQAARKESIKERINALKCVIYGRYLYVNNHLKLLSYHTGDKSFIPYEYFLSQNSELRRLTSELYDG